MDNDPSKPLDHTSEASAKTAAEPPLSPSPEDVMADVERLGATALRIKAERDEAVALLSIILGNSEVIPDPRMGGMADICAVPCDDIDEARALLARLT